MEAMISVENLIVDFENITACKNVSFQVFPGEIFGLIGPNGAGKTTTLKVLATLLKPTYGIINIGGFDLEKQTIQIRKIIGFMPDFSPVYEEMKVWEFLELYASAYGIEKNKRNKTIDSGLHRVNLVEKKDAFIGELSRGMKQRLVLAKTLLPEPQILFLDEPASGLDPLARKELSEILKNLGNEGKTIIISSHILTELADFCTAAGIMEKGRMIKWGKLENLSDIPADTVCVEFCTSGKLTNLTNILNNYPSLLKFEKETDQLWRIYIKGNDSVIADFVKFLVENNVPIIEIRKVKEDIQTIFFKTGAKDVS
ncbi:MAG TPA: ABC transporter ATP-binding protein [bacterium]|nr:ABC transporter ATP-binding protein [bacterium]